MDLCWGAEWVRPATWGVGDGPGLGSMPFSRGAGDAHGRRSVERRAVSVQRPAVHRLIAGSAGPCGVPATVTETG